MYYYFLDTNVASSTLDSGSELEARVGISHQI